MKHLEQANLDLFQMNGDQGLFTQYIGFLRFQVLEKFLGSVPSQIKYQQQILSMYLSCSGYLEDSNQCLDRVVCEYSDKTSSLQEDERDVVAM